MSAVGLKAGFIPLVDAAPLIVAREVGFAEEEGLALDLARAPSWSTLRDMLTFGQIEAAHMLSVMPVAMAMGLGGGGAQIDALQVMSVNGDAIAVSRDLAGKMRAQGYTFDFHDAAAAGRALIAASDARLRIGAPFPFSMHAELLYHWLGALGGAVPQALDVVTVPPPLMAQAIAAGEIDAFSDGRKPDGHSFRVGSQGAQMLSYASPRSFTVAALLSGRSAGARPGARLGARPGERVRGVGGRLAHSPKLLHHRKPSDASAFRGRDTAVLARWLRAHLP